jgi:hypothetical protein
VARAFIVRGSEELEGSMGNLRGWLCAAAAVGALAGCGGGGGGGGSVPAPAPPPPPPSAGPSPTCAGTPLFSAHADATVAVGKAAGAVIAGCTGPLSNVRWTQTGGPAVTLLAARSQAISFEPASPGTYTFTIDFFDAGGVPRVASVTTTAVAPATASTVLARVDQAVRAGGNVSLRAWPAAAAGETITWTQTAGPLVTLDTTDPNRVLFVAPSVANDTTLVFRVTRRAASGALDTDDVLVLVESYAQAPADPAGTGPYVFSDTHVSRVHPYYPGGPFAGVLVRCTYEANLQYIGAGMNTCPLATLPYLHQTTAGAVPTVSQIMARVAVSHDWMGQVFEEFLTTQANDDLKRLFNGVTAVVIGAQVRPSFYYALTGAIYLDADNFWLTAEQRDVINETPDFRSDFDRDLIYSSAWRYTENNASIFVSFSPTQRLSRSQSYLLAEAGWLLYHELAHASDFLPPARRGMLDNALTPWGNVGPWYSAGNVLPSDQLALSFPLQSAEMRALAQVKFQGVTATDVQKTYTPDIVASFFSSDRATDEYNYSTTREDAAMVFEEFMMFRNHGWRRDMAITDKITPTTTSQTLIVRWGQRGRVGTTSVKPRAELVVGQMAPWVPLADVQNLPAPIQMRPGDSWAGNLVLPAPPAGLAAVQSLRTPLDAESDRAALLRDLRRHHGQGSPNDRFLRRLGR